MLARISVMGGVEGYLIVDNSGAVLRHSKAMGAEQSSLYATEVLRLTARARHVVRDLDPRNELTVFRLKLKGGVEIISAPSDNCLVIVIQRWDAAPAPPV